MRDHNLPHTADGGAAGEADPGHRLGLLSAVGATGRISDLVSADDIRGQLAGRTVSVCVLARGEGAGAPHIARTIQHDLGESAGVVSEVVVVHAGLSARSLRRLRDCGADALHGADIRTDAGPVLGRGDLMWRSLHMLSGDLIVWIEGDFENFGSHVVLGLLAPLVSDPSVSLVRASAHPARRDGSNTVPGIERSVLARLDPAFVHVRDAVGGECAARRHVVSALDLEPDDGVEIGMLADLAARHGADSIREVDIGMRSHSERNATVRARQARQTMRAALARLGGPTVRGSLPLRPALASAPFAGLDLGHVDTRAGVRA